MIWILNGVWRLSYLGSPSMDAGVAVDQGHSVDDLGVIDQHHGQHDHGHLHRQEVSVAHGVLPGAVPCILERLRLVRLPQLCYVVCQRIIWVRCREKSLEKYHVCRKFNTIDVSPGWREGRFWSEVLDSISLWGCPGRFFPACRCSGGRSEWWTVPLALLWQSSNPLNPVLRIDVMLYDNLTLGAVIG